jgi:16S rRNA (guanine966-N2)-methyltransferase
MSSRANRSQLRIIGGQWRGRKLGFEASPGLRPTTDRVRETLFNWLQPVIHQARCLDLYAGSGALGLEALSRGAAHCDFIDTSSEAVRQIELHLARLDAEDRGECHRTSAEAFLRGASRGYHIVFIDPPFGQDLAGSSCDLLCNRGLLLDDARVYVETGAREPPPATPAAWTLHRDKTAGGVAYRLFVVGPG